MYAWYTLSILSMFLFLHGFFPITRTTKNVNNEPPTHINNVRFDPHVYASDIRKTIIIIIDALRLDFVNTRYMPLTSYITNQTGCFSTVTVEIPTVTLPRIKALTVGNVPQFIDLVLNLASTEILHDSLIHSMLKKGKRVIFYGDDTWLKLFPNSFTRYDGTNSFFVRDFNEVDDNVTRNIETELENDDWDVMILHYLGLDHIGHVYGPFSSHIPGKLEEMDRIINRIYSSIRKRNENFLLMVTGDHGMRDSGGHGGASYSETHVPLLLIGHECINGSLNQIDIPINLAVLLGLNIPSTCIGQLRPSLLQFPLEKYLFTLRYNNLLLLDKVNMCEDHFLLATKFHEMYMQGSEELYALKAIDLYTNCSNAISSYLLKSSVKQDFNSLIVAILIMLNILIHFIKYLFCEKCSEILRYTKDFFTYLIIIFIHFFLTVHMYSAIFIVVLVFILISNLISIIKNKPSFEFSVDITLLIIMSIIHPFTFFSSSFVEEEHQYWYFVNISAMIYVVLSNNKQSSDFFATFGLLSSLRFLRTINSTGDKWASYPDFSDWLLKIDNYLYYQLFFIFGLVTTFCTTTMWKRKYKENILRFIIFVCIYFLKSTDYESAMLGKFIWFLILCHTICFYNCPKIISWILVASLLLKPYNLFLIPYCIFASKFFSKNYQNSAVITLQHVWLSNLLYFAQGHSNSLASVDVSIGYIGLSEYNPLLVIIQILCHTYCFPVLCHFLLFENKNVNSNKTWPILFCNRLFIVIITCVITVFFRHHLFVWSVFAPKLFIESICLIFLFIEFNLYISLKKIKSYFSQK